MTQLVRRIGRWDRQLLLALVGRRTPRLDRLVRGWTKAGDPPVMLGGGLLLLAAPPWLPIPAGAGREATLVLLIGLLAGQLCKRRIARPRPELPTGLPALVQAPDRFSFPSGHATAGLAIALPVAEALDPAAAAVVLGLGLTVGVTRAYLGVHYPGDVLAGWGIAVLAFLLVQVAG